MSLFGRKNLRSAPSGTPATWSVTALGDDTGSILENSATEVVLTTAGTTDPDNGQFAYQTVSSGNIQLIARVPSSWTGGTPENFTFFGVQIREALTGTPVLAQTAWPNIGAARAKSRIVTDGAITTTGTGISGQSLPRYLAITYDDTAKTLKQWESANNSDWFQIGATISLTASYPIYAGVYGVSHDLFQTITAIMTVCSVSATLTIVEATPPTPDNRVGIIQDITALTDTFYAYGGAVTTDAGSFRTFDSSDNSFQNQSGGGTWDSNWDMARVDINTEESVSGSVDNNFIRFRLRYDQDYGAINGGGSNKPRNNILWGLGGNGVRYEDDREHWFAFELFFPSSYEDDSSSSGNQEVLLQLHNASGGSGHGNIQLGGSGSEQGRLNFNLQVNATTDTSSGSSEQNEAHIPIAEIKGKFITVVMNCRFNPFSTNTTVNSGMGRHPQVGEAFLANQGKYNVWMTVPPSASVISNTLGTVTNTTLDAKMMKICERNSEPVGLVPSWRNGVSGQNPLLHEFNIYKGQWMQQAAFASRPSIPHANSSKAGPIVIYWGQARMGDESSDYQSVHPTQEAQP